MTARTLPPVVALLRVSTEEQGRSGLGLEAQVEMIESWAERKGHEVLWMAREHVSGGAALEDREGLLSAIEVAKACGAELVVAKRDRLARDPLVSMLVEKQVAVHSADGTAEGNDPSAILLRRILDSVAEHERQVIKARTRQALAAKKRRGEPMGRAPYGWQYEDGALVEIASEQRILGRLLEMHEEGLGVRRIAKHLNDNGYLTRTGSQWHPTQVHRVVRRATELSL